MENQEQITKIQHFLPQFYLREFSESEKGIYRHDIEFPNKETVWTSIKKECSEPFLYEKKTETGELLEPNKLEKMFAQFETDFSNTIKAIKRKAHLFVQKKKSKIYLFLYPYSYSGILKCSNMGKI